MGSPWAGQPSRSLEIYYVDVEGGAATLIVTPAGESILIDGAIRVSVFGLKGGAVRVGVSAPWPSA